ADALAPLAEHPPIDAILLDLGLPDLQGLDGLRAVRERAPHVPVVVLTNNEDQGLAELALASGAQDYVVKRASDGLALARAITFAREREGRLTHIDRARRAAVHASAVKTELLGTVSHDIRTPLSTILGMGELLAETSLSPQQARYVESLRRAGDHLLSLVEDVLDLSRIEAGRLTLENNPFELARVVDRAIESLRQAAQRKGLELHSECSTDVPSWVVGDERRLRQI